MNIAMIPARLGSQRLPRKNLRELAGIPLITRAIQKCSKAGVFDEIWVNSEATIFSEIAHNASVGFHARPPELADNNATSEDYVYEFLQRYPCEWLFQVHSIAPLLTARQTAEFVRFTLQRDFDAVLSVVEEQIECAYDNRLINFSFDTKTNSQELKPIQRITWSISAWRCEPYLEAYEAGHCATYAGRVGFFPIDRMAGHIIKTEADLRIAEALLPLLLK